MDRIDRSVLAVAAAIVIYQLFIPPPIGLANNGDFGKLIARFNLGAPFENEFRYAASKYNFDPKYHYESGVYSSELISVYTALGLNALLFRDGKVDIRSIGAIHAALFLLALYLLLPVLRDVSSWRRILILALIVFVFSDAMYVTPLNSFYIDAGAFLFLLLAIVLFLRAARKRTRTAAVGFAICCVLTITTKTQHALLGLPLALFVLWKGSQLWTGNRFKFMASSAMLLAMLVTWKSAPENHHEAPLYTSIFTGLLPGSKNVAEDLISLGLDVSDARYVGTNGFTAGNPLGDEAFLKRFRGRVSYLRLGYFFLKHPPSAYRVITDALSEAGRQKPNLGSYDKSAGKPEWAESQTFTMWSWPKRGLFYWHGQRYLWYTIAIVLFSIVVAATRANNAYAAPAALLVSMTMIEMGVAGFGDAAEITRHFFLFNALLDILLLSALTAVLALPACSVNDSV